MPSRRQFLRQGLGAIALGLSAQRGLAEGVRWRLAALPGRQIGPDPANPFLQLDDLPPSVVVDGLPFADWFTGDYFLNDQIPFHSFENLFPDGQPPAPTEEVDLAIVGGGLAGLCAAYLLRQFRPVLFDLRPRFGGNASGEIWRGTSYSLGGAYVITPDDGTFLDSLYRELGLDHAHRLDQGENTMELNRVLRTDFFSGSWIPADQRPAFDRYRQIVAYYANDAFPDIPLDEGVDNQWILDLDRITLRQDIENRMNGLPIPPLLHAGIQSYCYSSFGAGYEQISAAGGWNFLAAEEFGRWVFPGGNAYMAEQFWTRIAQAQQQAAHRGPGDPGRPRLRPGHRVADVRMAPGSGGRVQVTCKNPDGQFESLLARRVVMCCSKHLCKYILHDVATLDNAKYEAMQRVQPTAYVVINVLIESRMNRDFYDLFLLRDGSYPASDFEASQNSRVCDAVNGQFARNANIPRTVLTLYWPLPWGNSRFTLFTDDVFQSYAQAAVPQIDYILQLLGLSRSDVRQVRMTRWGHAFPVSSPSFIADGNPQQLLRPFEGAVYFVNQDDWSLPAVENSLLDAKSAADAIAADL